MLRIIRNKLSIIPKASNAEEYDKQLDDVFRFCRGNDDKGVMKEMLFQKIAPIPEGFDPESRELDDWLLHNWGCRDRAFNACWISEDEMIFDTFYYPAIPIAYKIMKHFPNIDFSYKYSSSKTGANSGEIYTSKGSVFFSKEKDYSKRAYDIAFELRPHLRDLYTLNMTTHTYDYDTSDIKAMIAQNGFYKDTDGTMLIGVDDKKKPLFDGPDDLPF